MNFEFMEVVQHSKIQDFVIFGPLPKNTQYHMMEKVRLRPLANFLGGGFGIFGKPKGWR